MVWVRILDKVRIRQTGIRWGGSKLYLQQHDILELDFFGGVME